MRKFFFSFAMRQFIVSVKNKKKRNCRTNSFFCHRARARWKEVEKRENFCSFVKMFLKIYFIHALLFSSLLYFLRTTHSQWLGFWSLFIHLFHSCLFSYIPKHSLLLKLLWYVILSTFGGDLSNLKRNEKVLRGISFIYTKEKISISRWCAFHHKWI